VGVSARNISQFDWYNSFRITWLGVFRTRTENLRVGGSIPPPAAAKLLSFQYFLIEQFLQLQLVCQECGAPWKGAISQWEVGSPTR
jgi:hypothetical protein